MVQCRGTTLQRELERGLRMKTDIEIAQEAQMLPIMDVAADAGIDEKYLE